MIDLHVRFKAYDSAGVFLGFLRPSSWSASVQHNDAGTLSMTYPRVSLNGGILQRGLEQGLEIGMEVATHDGTWVEPYNCRFLLVSRSRDAKDHTDTVTLNCMTWIWLTKKILNLNMSALLTDTDNKGKRPFYSATSGMIVHTLLDENRERGGAATVMPAGFNSSQDTNGDTWASKMTLYYDAGIDLYTVIDNLSANGLCDWRTDGHMLKLWNADSTALCRDLSARVRIQLATGLLESPEEETIEGLAGNILIKGDNLVFTQENPAAPTPWGKWELYTSQGGVSNKDTAQLLMQTQLASAARVRGQYTRQILTDDIDHVPLVDYRPGDWITAPTVTHGEKVRVQRIELSNRNDGGVKCALMLNDRLYDAQTRQAKRIQGITGGAVAGGASGATPAPEKDHRVPKAPTGLVVQTDAYLDANGYARGLATAHWAAVTQATNSTSIEISSYRVEWRPNTAGETWRSAGVTTDTTLSWGDLDCGTTIQVRVRAVPTYSDKLGDWSAVTFVDVEQDVTPPSVPSVPQLASETGIVTIHWDGKTATGARMETDFDHIEVGRGTGANNIALIAATQSGEGDYLDTSLTGGDKPYYALRAVDHADNKSEWSEYATITVASTVSPDEINQIKTDLKTNQTAINQANKDIAAAKDDIKSNQTAINQAKEDLKANQQAVSTVSADVAKAKQDILANSSKAQSAESKAQAAKEAATNASNIASASKTTADNAFAISDEAKKLAQQSAANTIVGTIVEYAVSDSRTEISPLHTYWTGAQNNSVSVLEDRTFETYWTGAQNNSVSVLKTFWDTATPTLNAGEYAWMRVRITYGDGRVEYAQPSVITGENGMAGVSVVAISTFWRIAFSSPEKPTEKNPSGWSQTEPAYQRNMKLWSSSRIDYSNGTFSWTSVSQVSAYTAVEAAHTSAVDAAEAATRAETAANSAQTVASTSAADAANAKSAADKAQAAATNSASSAAAAADSASSASRAATTSASEAAKAAGIANGKADVLIQSATPAAGMRKATTLWIDTTNGANTPKRWNGSTWVAVTDKKAIDAANQAANAAQAAQAAQSTANDAKDAAANADAKAVKAHAIAANAQTTADSKNTIYQGRTDPRDDAEVAKRIVPGDLWWQTSTKAPETYWTGAANDSVSVLVDHSHDIEHMWVWDGTMWQSHTLYAQALLVNGSISTELLAANVVTAEKIKAGSINTDKLAANAITTEKIKALAVNADKIAANAVVSDKIAANAITAEKIKALAVNADKIAANAVTTAKIAALAVNADKIAANAVVSDKIAANAVVSDKIAANAVNADKIAANAITAEKIKALAITADKIAANTITTDKIKAGQFVGYVFTGAVFQSHMEDSKGFKLRDGALDMWNSNGDKTVHLDGNGQENLIVGTLQTALSGDRIVISPKFSTTTVGSDQYQTGSGISFPLSGTYARAPYIATESNDSLYGSISTITINGGMRTDGSAGAGTGFGSFMRLGQTRNASTKTEMATVYMTANCDYLHKSPDTSRREWSSSFQLSQTSGDGSKAEIITRKPNAWARLFVRADDTQNNGATWVEMSASVDNKKPVGMVANSQTGILHLGGYLGGMGGRATFVASWSENSSNSLKEYAKVTHTFGVTPPAYGRYKSMVSLDSDKPGCYWSATTCNEKSGSFQVIVRAMPRHVMVNTTQYAVLFDESNAVRYNLVTLSYLISS